MGNLFTLSPEDFEADLAGVLRAERLEDVFLYLPGVASLAGTRAQGEYLGQFYRLIPWGVSYLN